MDQFSHAYRLPNGNKITNGELWRIADKWEVQANEGKNTDEPRWSWDCNFRLDFDGALETVRISSRFYPPHKNDGDFWEGNISVMAGAVYVEDAEDLLTVPVKADDLAALKAKVDMEMIAIKKRFGGNG